jgi:hypothetical protein
MRETDIEEFDAVDKNSLVDSKAGDVLEGYREPLLPIQIACYRRPGGYQEPLLPIQIV